MEQRNKNNEWEEINDKEKMYICFMQTYHNLGLVTQAHIHDFIEVLYGVNCNYKIYADNTVYDFKSGDMIIFHSNQLHSVISKDKGGGKHICLKFNINMLVESDVIHVKTRYKLPFLLKESEHKIFFKKEELFSTGISEIMWGIYEEERDKKYGYELNVVSDLYKLVLFFLRMWEDCEDDNKINVADEGRIVEILKYIEENYDGENERITVDKLAKMSYMSYSYFLRWFKKVTGKTFKQYVNTVKIDHAAQMLVNSDLSVSEIAIRNGFPTTSYFIKQFKNLKNGYSPKEFRKLYK